LRPGELIDDEKATRGVRAVEGYGCVDAARQGEADRDDDSSDDESEVVAHSFLLGHGVTLHGRNSIMVAEALKAVLNHERASIRRYSSRRRPAFAQER
jgi:hypothetical protein